jgi:glycosyltransferase involved in cell wall biosynthesis
MILVSIIYPADPFGVIPGEFGIDSFIRTLIKSAPQEFRHEIIGVSSDPVARPVGKWSRCALGGKDADFFPVMAKDHSGRRSRIPLSLRFTLRLLASGVRPKGDVLEFHRLEPSILFIFDKRPKNVFIHQDMKQICNPQSDILWRHLPSIFNKLEKLLIPRVSSLFTVSEEGCREYKRRFPLLEEKIRYTPTFMDPEVFSPAPLPDREQFRASVRKRFGLPDDVRVGVFVGRLDQQKDPALLVESFAEAAKANPRLFLLMIGDGVLREQTLKMIERLGLVGRCILAGLLPAREIADVHRGADLFLLASAYEGMPIALLEAMACGLPAVVTAVGEVPKIIKPGINGELVLDRNPVAFANEMTKVLSQLSRYAREASLETAAFYTPRRVLQPVYLNYRRLSEAVLKGVVQT